MTANEVEFKNFFRNETVSLIEVQKNEESSWFFSHNDLIDLSTFHCSNEMVELINDNNINVRTFEEGEFRFDTKFGKLVVTGEDSQLVIKSTIEEIPSVLKDKVEKVLH